MKPWKTVVGIALPALALGACAVLPERDAEIDDARAAVRAAQNDPQVVSLASVELNQAVEAMRRADASWEVRVDLAEVHHLAYLAWTRAAIATETARLKSAEASVASADQERTRIRLAARTRDAERAQQQVALAQRNAQAAQAQATGAAQQAQAAREQADAARAQAESLQSSLSELRARPTDRGMVVTLGDLLFDTGRARLNPGGVRVVDHLADFMRQYPQRRVSIEGFADSTGNPASNQELSERRASVVRLALIDQGIDPGRLVARGYGEEYPVASNANSAGRQMNRRVEIVISDEHGMIGSRGGPPVATVGRGPRG